MSKKEARLETLSVYKSNLKKTRNQIATDNFRVLTKLRSDLENSWAQYSDVHHEYAIKEKSEDDLNAAIKEHEQLDDDQDNLIVTLDEAIEVLTAPPDT